MKKQAIDLVIDIELDKATKKHPDWPTDIIHAAAIVMEEAGELIQACLDVVYFEGKLEDVRDEAISVAAMAKRFLFHLPTGYNIESPGRDPRFKRKDKE